MPSNEYRVTSGDTLSAIARRHHVSMDVLARLNGISDVNRIYVGQVLKLPEQGPRQQLTPKQPQTHRVFAGETLDGIANRFVVPEEELRAANNIPEKGSAFLGQMLVLPQKDKEGKLLVHGRRIDGSKSGGGKTAPDPSVTEVIKPPVVRKPSASQNSRGATNIDAIILHHTASNSAERDLVQLTKKGTDVSAHYLVVPDGTIYQLVEDDKRAWHAGVSALHGQKTPDVNSRSIGIEITNDGLGKTPFTEAQYKALEQLVPYLAVTYEVPMENILGHRDVAPDRKKDPADNFDWARVRGAVNAARGGSDGGQTAPTGGKSLQWVAAPSLDDVMKKGAILSQGMKGPAVEQLQKELVRTGYLTNAQVKTGPGHFGPATRGAVESFQRQALPPVPADAMGSVAKATWEALRNAKSFTVTPSEPQKPKNPTDKTPSDNGVKKIEKPTEAALAGLKVDFAFISEREGGQWLKGYVPAPKSSQSGVTIATGFDLGSRDVTNLEDLGLPQSLIDKFKKYLGKKKEEAKEFLRKNPLTITKAEADLIDRVSKKEALLRVWTAYNQAVKGKSDLLGFEQLPAEAQTVITSVGFQYGTLSERTPKFWKAIIAQRWQDAVKELRNFGDAHQPRHDAEADLLAKILEGGSSATPKKPQQPAPKKPQQGLDLMEIARSVREAMAGAGTNEDKVYTNLAKLNHDESLIRQFKIRYKATFHVDVEDDIESDFSNKSVLPLQQKYELNRALGYLTPKSVLLDEIVRNVHDAMFKSYNNILGLKVEDVDEEKVYSNLVKLNNDHALINEFKSVYKARHGSDVEAHIRSKFSNNLMGFELDRALGYLKPIGSQPQKEPPNKPPQAPSGGVTVDLNNPILVTLSTGHLDSGKTGLCVTVVRKNMTALRVPTYGPTGDDQNNSRGALVQLLRSGKWESLPLAGSKLTMIHSKMLTGRVAYGSAEAYVCPGRDVLKAASQDQIPVGAIIFQTMYGWDYGKAPQGNDVGIVRKVKGVLTTFNYEQMPSLLVHEKTKKSKGITKDDEVVLLVPKGAILGQ